jgi:hypothetical protein
VKANLVIFRKPPLPAGALWGTLRFEVDNLAGRTINVYGPGWYQANFNVQAGAAYRPMRVTFTPSAAAQAELLGITGSGYIFAQYCPIFTGCR